MYTSNSINKSFYCRFPLFGLCSQPWGVGPFGPVHRECPLPPTPLKLTWGRLQVCSEVPCLSRKNGGEIIKEKWLKCVTECTQAGAPAQERVNQSAFDCLSLRPAVPPLWHLRTTVESRLYLKTIAKYRYMSRNPSPPPRFEGTFEFCASVSHWKHR